ncbi:hypothetical protein PUN28_020529 [Cardiocondyla obscurior]|uniref:Uncharacterized protein n=1 Tax=Cardiocondyla obscurior TaxID=286306 RepID=A0AAW2E778_9HYME
MRSVQKENEEARDYLAASILLSDLHSKKERKTQTRFSALLMNYFSLATFITTAHVLPSRARVRACVSLRFSIASFGRSSFIRSTLKPRYFGRRPTGAREYAAVPRQRRESSLSPLLARRARRRGSIGYHRYAAHSRAPQRVRIAEIEAARERASRNTAMRTTLESLFFSTICPGSSLALSSRDLDTLVPTDNPLLYDGDECGAAHAVVASHKLFSPLDLAILLERSVASRDGRSDEEWEGGADSEDAILSAPYRGRQRSTRYRARVRFLVHAVAGRCALVTRTVHTEQQDLRNFGHLPGNIGNADALPRTSPKTSLNHSIGSSDGRCVQRAGTLALNGSSLKDLKCTHSDYGASDESRIVIFRRHLKDASPVLGPYDQHKVIQSRQNKRWTHGDPHATDWF